MENLRADIESDLAETLESEFKIAVELTGPDGVVQKHIKGSTTELLGGRVQYSTRKENPETGELIIVNELVVTLRIASLNRVPAAGEKWLIKVPVSPLAGAEKKSYTFTPTRAATAAYDIGFMNIYPQKLKDENEL